MKRILLFFLAIIMISCNSGPVWVKNQNTGPALGTGYSIIYISDEKVDYQKEIDSVFTAINQSMSTYLPNSDISKINNGDSTIVVDEMFKEVFHISSTVHKESNGYFDPTIGVLVNAWGFGPGKQMELDSVMVDSLLQYVGWNNVLLRKDNTVSKLDSKIRFDFNAIAKGYAIDRLGVMLTNKGIDNYLIEVGGEILARGRNRITDKNWTVGIDSPNNVIQRGTAAVIHLLDKGMASSGNYRKFRFDKDTGEKYVHTIDPKTGFTKNGNVLAATVIANDCATADAFATAFMAMDFENSIRLLNTRDDLEAYIIYLDDTNKNNEFMTQGFKSLLVE